MRIPEALIPLASDALWAIGSLTHDLADKIWALSDRMLPVCDEAPVEPAKTPGSLRWSSLDISPLQDLRDVAEKSRAIWPPRP